MRMSTLLGFAGAAAVMLAGGAALAQCGPGAIGVSRQVAIDASGGPKFGQVQYHGTDFLQPGEIVLTFDDGPHKQLTPVVLNLLAQHCTKATFFMLGQRAMMYSDLVKEVAGRGHTIATHTWSHANLRQKSADGAVAEIELGISGVQKGLGGAAAPFFRFPYLADSPSAMAHLKARNTAAFSIDVDSRDFRTRSPTVVIRNVMQQLKARGRGIILFHDIQPSTAGALGALLTDLKAGGYRVVHIVPSHGQVTLAEFDRRVGAPAQTIAGRAVPVSHRAAVAPAWEPRVTTSRHASLPSETVQAAAPVAAPAQPVVKPIERPVREREADDWRKTIFRGY